MREGLKLLIQLVREIYIFKKTSIGKVREFQKPLAHSRQPCVKRELPVSGISLVLCTCLTFLTRLNFFFQLTVKAQC